VTIEVRRDGSVTFLTLDRAERRNALDTEHCTRLTSLVHAAVADGSRVIVLGGAGPHFCAGADLTGVEDSSFVTALGGALDSLATVPVPTIAAVQGAALGAGTQLAIACDLRVAEATARFGIPAAKLGLMVDHWTMQRLALTAGYSTARAMLLTAEELDGAAAYRVGFAQRLASEGTTAQDAAGAWANDIAALAPLTIAGHKLGLNALEQVVRDDAGRPADEAVQAAFARAWSSDDLAEGMAARNERRPPGFQGR
jgi:enoyl-CoA hydratase